MFDRIQLILTKIPNKPSAQENSRTRKNRAECRKLWKNMLDEGAQIDSDVSNERFVRRIVDLGKLILGRHALQSQREMAQEGNAWNETSAAKILNSGHTGLFGYYWRLIIPY